MEIFARLLVDVTAAVDWLNVGVDSIGTGVLEVLDVTVEMVVVDITVVLVDSFRNENVVFD